MTSYTRVALLENKFKKKPVAVCPRGGRLSEVNPTCVILRSAILSPFICISACSVICTIGLVYSHLFLCNFHFSNLLCVGSLTEGETSLAVISSNLTA